ncbi:uncharacterized protein LOC107857171 isoform X2 [Capsicum annuum]|uniref:uncharacterized protein LOC107857171 isoform X2 n=1 Tax=Capsicum annuum TaxID=4072 RepID=UPI001FB060CB|nr:uncharacterized protein LOC107857171 isoform X2 [Capsicum annuum]
MVKKADATHPPAHSQSQSSTSSLLASDDLYGFSKEQHDHLLSMLQQNRLHDSGLCASATFGHSLKKPLEVGKLSNGLYVLQLNDSLQLPTITSQVAAFNVSISNTIFPLFSTIPENFSFPVSSGLCDKNVYSDIVPPIEPNSITSFDDFSSVSLPNSESYLQTHDVCRTSLDCTNAASPDLAWHQRLGHMPFAKMKAIPFLKSVLPNKQIFHCSICPMTRQQSLPFSESVIHSTILFHLVHLELWGP